MRIEEVANSIKKDLELAITQRLVDGSTSNKKGKEYSDGAEAKTSLIRSSALINHVHEFVKHELVRCGVDRSAIYPPINSKNPEIKLTGMFKRKNQDVCVLPRDVEMEKTEINWGPMLDSDLYCEYGSKYTEKVLSINVRSQLSSLAKNSDTLFERMFAETLNLHELYPRLVMGEVYVIPVYEYDDRAMKNDQVAFKNNPTDIEKYIKFFNYLSGRDGQDLNENKQKYERCALVIIDFRGSEAKVYNTTTELIEDGLVSKNFKVELDNISITSFADDILDIYTNRFSCEDADELIDV